MARGLVSIAVGLHLVWAGVLHGQTEAGAQRDAVSPFVHVKQFGAQGDGATDDTEAIQAAIDAVGVDGGTLLFPPGTYVVTSVGLRPGVRYLGYGATIKRPAQQGKWVRTFNTARKGYMYSGDDDSRALVIEGLTFDGSLAEQGEYTKYQLEQAHLVFLVADRNRAGRLRATVVNCHFRDCVADAVSVYTNVEAQIRNCTARDCFRGGITVTGGYTRVQITDFTAQGTLHPTGIDVETDGAGFGKSLRVEVSINGLILPDGDFDIAVRDGSTVLGTNIMARAPFYLHARESTVRLSNSTFGVGRYSAFSNRIVHPGDVVLDNCRFSIDGESAEEAAKWAAIHVYWNISGGELTDQSLKLVDCDFGVGPGIAETDQTYAVYCEADRAERNNRLLVDGARIPSDFDYGVYIAQGGRVALRGGDIRAATPMFLGSSAEWLIDALIDSVRIEGTERYAVIPTHGPEHRFTHHNVLIDETVNRIETSYGIARNRYLGSRTILGSAPPSGKTHGLLGDVYRLKTPAPGNIHEWLCTRTACGKGAVWMPLTKVGAEGEPGG